MPKNTGRGTRAGESGSKMYRDWKQTGGDFDHKRGAWVLIVLGVVLIGVWSVLAVV